MRAKHSVPSRRRKKKILQQAKGYWGDRSKKYRRAVETLRRAGAFSYVHRRRKKREFRALWITRIGAGAAKHKLSYRELMHGLQKNKIRLSRDILAQLAAQHPAVFDQVVEAAKK